MTPQDRLKEIEDLRNEWAHLTSYTVKVKDMDWIISRVKSLEKTGNRIIYDPVLSSKLAIAIWENALEGKTDE